ncbi:MAG: hypothetical protein LC740_17730 [Actinobacteria bacterium]|nr:hypothetical protein [Actinomycetota bacterium]
MHLANYLGYLHQTELDLAEGYRKVGEAYPQEADVYHLTHTLAKQCKAHAEKLKPFVDSYGEEKPEEPEKLYHEFFSQTRSGGLGLLRDLQDLYLMVSACDISWTMIGQAAQGLRDRELLEVVNSCEMETYNQLKWIRTRMKVAAPQALIVAS